MSDRTLSIDDDDLELSMKASVQVLLRLLPRAFQTALSCAHCMPLLWSFHPGGAAATAY